MTTREENLKILSEGIEVVKGSSVNFSITEETKIRDLELDSLDVVELQMYYEDKMGVTIKDPDGPVVSVSQLLDLM